MRSYDEKRTPRRGEGRNDGRSARNAPVIGGPFSLIGSDGRLVTEKDLQGGDWILIYFGYTASPDVGPAELAKLAKVINTLEFDERIMGLTGPVGAIRQMANEYRVPFKKVEEDGDDYLVETSHGMYLMNPSMEFVKSFGLRYTANQLSQEIQKEVQKTQN
ncbi:putative copper chaperone SCO1/SenC, Thioredoxin-like superfamily [Helianthus annuus]|nr:putative copper chaperone SCO1/SenC, Thioredoxin-like superfamily [Helianthus annuus]